MIQLAHLVVWLAVGAAATQVGDPTTLGEAGAGTAVTPSEAVGVPAGDSAEDAPVPASPVPPAGSQDLAWKRSDEAAAIVAEREWALRAELSMLIGHDWAGSYLDGGGHTRKTLMLAPDNGFSFAWHGCLGLYDRNHGTVRQEGRRLLLDCAWDNDRPGLPKLPTELHIVPWGERRYLIPADRMVDFTTWIHRGYEPRRIDRGGFLLRRGDALRPVSGRPELPPPWQAYLLDAPIEATILAVGRETERPAGSDRFVTVTTPVTVRVESAGLLLPGMELSTVDAFEHRHSVTVEITDVWGPVARGRVRDLRRATEALRPDSRPHLGCRLSTHRR